MFSPGLSAERVRNMLVLHHQTKSLLPAFGSAVVTIEPDDLKGLLQPKGFYDPIVPCGTSLRHASRLCATTQVPTLFQMVCHLVGNFLG